MASASSWKLYNTNRIALIGMSVLSVLLAISTLATGANTIKVFNQTWATNEFWLAIWTNYSINGARSLVGASATVLILQSIYLFTSLLPKFNLKAHPTVTALNTMVASVLSSAILLVAIIFAHVLNHQSPDTETIQSWTCAKQHFKKTAGAAKTSAVDNSGFASLCTQSRFAIWGALAIFLLQLFMFTAGVVGFVMGKLAARRERKSGSSSPDGSLELVGTGYATDKHSTTVQARPY